MAFQTGSWYTFTSTPLFSTTYLVLVLLLVCLLPQFPVEVQLVVKHGRCPDAQRDNQQTPQHQA